MNIEEKKIEAKRLLDEQHFTDAVNLYREIAEEEPNWGNYYAFLGVNNFNAYLTNEIGNLQGAVNEADETIRITIQLSENEELMEKAGDQVIKLYAEACKIKGQSIFENNQTDENCVHPLMEAIKYGKNEANYYLGLYYFYCSKNDNFDGNTINFAKYMGDYVDNLTGNEDPDRIVHMTNYLISLYESGTAVEKDLNQAAKYRSIQNKVTGNTDVEAHSQKKKGLFGF